ncbi:MAG: hypothetical protein KME27_23370 [Lyngbya sp. HA4199-MV5]|jgi:hypothetical protein|nr:hypothetical protein [Lyngbya sp. HA4199-MV5]
MTEKMQEIIQRVVAGSRDEADLQAITAALRAGDVILATGDRSIAIGGNVSNSVIVTGDNNHVIFLAEEAAIALERILQQWQPKQGQYVQPKRCQNRQECDRYLEVVLQRLERLGSPEILKDEVYKGRSFNYIARMVDFEPGLGMRGEAFFLFSEFAFINLNVLKPFSNESSQWARARANPAAAGQALYNFRMPTHFCFAVALVDQVEETVAVGNSDNQPLWAPSRLAVV